jgi:DeoR/GlpR family transcriptional regulator of sugar metabolism
MTILSGGGISARHGLSTQSFTTATADRAAAAAADRIVALADHTKIGRDNLCQIVPCAAIRILVTDSRSDVDELQLIKELGVEVRTASINRQNDGFGHRAPGQATLGGTHE